MSGLIHLAFSKVKLLWAREIVPARPYLLARCSILRSRDESRFTGESNGQRQWSPGTWKNSPTLRSPTPINSISRYFATSRRTMDITRPFSPSFAPSSYSSSFSVRFFFLALSAQNDKWRVTRLIARQTEIWMLDPFHSYQTAGLAIALSFAAIYAITWLCLFLHVFIHNG